MAGKGKVGKQAGKNGAKRNTKVNSRTDSVAAGTVTNGSIRRLARRGGVRRIASGCHNGVREYIDNFLDIIVRDSATYS